MKDERPQYRRRKKTQEELLVLYYLIMLVFWLFEVTLKWRINNNCQAQGPLSRPDERLDKFMKSQERTLI